MSRRHWQFKVDPADGARFGRPCDCPVGQDHDDSVAPRFSLGIADRPEREIVISCQTCGDYSVSLITSLDQADHWAAAHHCPGHRTSPAGRY